MVSWLQKNDFKNLTFFGQDWGGLIGLRMIAEDPDRFTRVAMGNTGLPYNPNTPKDVVDKVKKFRSSNKKITLFSVGAALTKWMVKACQLIKRKHHPATKFMYWQKFTWETKNLPIGMINAANG